MPEGGDTVPRDLGERCISLFQVFAKKEFRDPDRVDAFEAELAPISMGGLRSDESGNPGLPRLLISDHFFFYQSADDVFNGLPFLAADFVGMDLAHGVLEYELQRSRPLLPSGCCVDTRRHGRGSGQKPRLGSC